MSKVSLKTANRNKKATFDVSSTHITTLDVGQLRPTYILPMYAGEDISVNYGQFSRLSPLVAPTFGSFRLKSYAFFVPHRIVFDKYEDFRSGSADVTTFKRPPRISQGAILGLFQKNSMPLFTGNYFSLPDSGQLPQPGYRTAVAMFIARLSVSNFPKLVVPSFAKQKDYVYFICRSVSSALQTEFIAVDLKSLGYDYPNQFYSLDDALLALNKLGIELSSYHYSQTGLSFKSEYEDVLSPSVDYTLEDPRFYSAPDYISAYTPDRSTPVKFSSLNVVVSSASSVTIDSPNEVNCSMYRPRVLTSQGRWLYNIFTSLGYGINFVSNIASQYYNAIPLYSFCRVLFDYVYPSQWVQQQGFGGMFGDPKDIVSVDDFDDIVSLLLVSYDKDFYTQLWTEFNSPAKGMTRPVTPSTSSDIGSVLDEQTSGSSQYVGGQDGKASLISFSGSSNTPLSSLSGYGLRLLQAMSDFFERNSVGGGRFREWMKSHFGFVTSEQQSHYSIFLKSWSDEIQISDVTNTSAGDTNVLGEQAGRGIGRSSGSLKFSASEDGYFIVLSMVVPIIGYYQGAKPWTRVLSSPEQLYLAEFDSMGNAPVPFSELFADFKDPDSYRSALSSGYSYDGVFGFAPRYNEYKHGFDFLTGDFRFDSRNTGLDSYHTMRVLPSPSKETPLVLDAEFLRVDNQYNRIFAADPRDGDGSSLYDKIFTIFQFNVKAHRHMLTISESLPLFDKQGRETTVSMGGNSI